MREILFRGKRLDNGEWVEGQTIVVIHQDDNDLIFMPQHGEDVKADPMEGNDRALTSIYGNYYQILPQTIGQYTGLNDKTGKKIFDGDIISCGYLCDFFVEYSEEDAEYWANFGDSIGSLHTYFDSKRATVIGNIYDNPELLEVTE